MAAPGTQELVRQDRTNKLLVDNFTLTTQPGGVHLTAYMRILFAQATVGTFVAEPVTISVVIDSDERGATVSSTSDSPLLVFVELKGEA